MEVIYPRCAGRPARAQGDGRCVRMYREGWPNPHPVQDAYEPAPQLRDRAQLLGDPQSPRAAGVRPAHYHGLVLETEIENTCSPAARCLVEESITTPRDIQFWADAT